MNKLQEVIYSDAYADIIIPYAYTTPERFLQSNEQYFPQIIDKEYGFLHLPTYMSTTGANTSFFYSLIPNLFVPLDTTSLEEAGIIKAQTQPALMLSGKNILLGLIDTGIQYTHPAFQLPGKRTKIVRIWDQTIPSPSNDGPFGYGTVFTEEDINRALNSDDPLAVVPSTDLNGHGTYLAGIAAGTPDAANNFLGVAYDAKIAMVRLKEAKPHLKKFYYFSGNVPVYQETDIMTGIQYLLTLSRQLRLPLVLCIALGNNQGDHMGYTPLDLSIRQLTSLPGVAVVIAGGNEAGKAHHYFGAVPSQTDYKSVEIFVRENTKGFFLELWGQPPELFSVGFRSPTGEVIPRIPASLGQTEVVRFFLEDSRIIINYDIIQNTSGSQLIFIRFENPTQGIWTMDVYCKNRLNGEFHTWLPVSGFLSPDVTFLSPDPFTTITTPGNSVQVITVSAYNAYTNSIFINSSRGYSRSNQVKPDFAAPGVDVTGPDLRAGYINNSGTSASAALTAGSAALLLEWGIKERYPLYLSTYEVKNFLIRGATRRPELVYPNREWGYGTLNLYQVFSSISTT